MTKEQLAKVDTSVLSFMLEVLEEADKTDSARYALILDELKSRVGVPTSN